MQQISMDSALTGLFVVMILLPLFYDALKRLYPGLDPLFMLFGHASSFWCSGSSASPVSGS